LVKRLALFAAWTLTAATASAAGVSVSAEVSRNQLAVGDRFTLTVTVDGASPSSIRLPPMEAFNVYDSGQEHSMNFVNGQLSSSSVFSYVLAPRGPGKFKIPPITVDGAAPTPALDVEVFPSGQAPTQAQVPASAVPAAPGPGAAAPRTGRSRDIFITATLDKTRAFVNQQVTLTIRFLNAVRLVNNISYNPPSTTGFFAEELPPVRSGTTQIDGRPYEVREIKVALFPLEPGRLKIGSAAVQCLVPRARGGASIEDLLNNFMSMQAAEPVTVNSDPLTLQVDPLPTGKPADFTGVVGKLTAHAAAEKTSVKAGDAVALTVTVAGIGNVKSIPDPRKPELPALRFFETESASVVDKAKDRVGGSKSFKTVVVPRVSGRVRVPPFSFSYFDPETKAYARAQTEPVDLNVAPGAAGAAPALTAASPSAPGLTAFGEDIRYLKTSPEHAPISAVLSAFADLGPMHALPLAVFLAAAAFAWRRRAADADPRGRRVREALARADARLKEAASLPAAEAARATALIGEAMTGYAADKLVAAAAGLTLKTAVDGLKGLAKPPSDASLERLRAAWEEADLRRFAPGAAGDDVSLFAQSTSELLKKIDEEVRR
jgi:hypothetical protein